MQLTWLNLKRRNYAPNRVNWPTMTIFRKRFRSNLVMKKYTNSIWNSEDILCSILKLFTSRIFYDMFKIIPKLLQMHSSMEVNDQRLENIQIGFWNPKKCAMDQERDENISIKSRTRTRSFSGLVDLIWPFFSMKDNKCSRVEITRPGQYLFFLSQIFIMNVNG